MIVRWLLALALLFAPAYASAQATMTGAAQTPGGRPLDIQPGAQFIQSCNAGAGGFVGQGSCTVPTSGSGGGPATAAAGSFADGYAVTMGFQADAACGTDNGTCTQMALLKRSIQRLTTLINAIGSPLQAGGHVIVDTAPTTAITGAASSFADGALITVGAQADAACASDNGTCTQMALLKRENQRLTSILTALGTPMQATGGTVSTQVGDKALSALPTILTSSTGTLSMGSVAGANFVTAQFFTSGGSSLAGYFSASLDSGTTWNSINASGCAANNTGPTSTINSTNPTAISTSSLYCMRVPPNSTLGFTVTTQATGASYTMLADAGWGTYNPPAVVSYTVPFATTSTMASVTLGSAGTFSTVLASNTTRRSCLIQNTSAEIEYLFVGANGSATTATSFQIPAAGFWSCDAVGGTVATDNISMAGKVSASDTVVVQSK